MPKPKHAEVDPQKTADLFAKTAPESAPEQAAPLPVKAPDPVTSRGVGLRASEWKRMEEIAGELGMKPGSLAAFALRFFLRSYERGEVPIESKPRPKLPGE